MKIILGLGVFFLSFLVFLNPGPGFGAGVAEDPVAGMEFVFIKGGCFRMGSETGDRNEQPVHTVCLGDFHLGRYEVTQGQWKAVMEKNPSFFDQCGDTCPVENVSWADTQEFIRRLNRKAGADRYRLPTEAEWEYAARAGSEAKYSFGDNPADLPDYAWYRANSAVSGSSKKFYLNQLISASSQPVGGKKPNALGLHDLYGNVWEWVQDWYGNYSSGQVQDPGGPPSGSNRVFRGGSWDSDADLCRSAKRFSGHPLSTDGDLGFRLVRNP